MSITARTMLMAVLTACALTLPDAAYAQLPFPPDQIDLTLKAVPPHPKAGQGFVVKVKLSTKTPHPLSITFEKHRIYVDTSGKHELCLVDAQTYFAEQGFPDPIEIAAKKTSGQGGVTVLGQASSRPCPFDPNGGPASPVPVLFPDRLLLTAFVTSPTDGRILGKEHLAVTINPASR